jgi:hypothetical protein
MDPVTAVGLAASVAQLATLAIQTFSSLVQYFDDVKDAPKQSRELRDELLAISDLLHPLEDVLKSDCLSGPNTSFVVPLSLQSAVQEFQVLLEGMQARVTKAHTQGFRRLKWPFTKDENERFLTKIGRYKSTFVLGLNIKGS